MKKTYDIRLDLLSAMHINGGVAADSKRIIVKCDNQPFIPATLFKGIVRANFEMLINTFDTDNISISGKLFGSEGYNRSHIIFDNLMSETDIPLINRANNAVDRYTRKVNDKALVFSETASCFDTDGNRTSFRGKMTVYYSAETEKYESYLLRAVEMVSAVGSGKSRGLGFAKVSIAESEENAV